MPLTKKLPSPPLAPSAGESRRLSRLGLGVSGLIAVYILAAQVALMLTPDRTDGAASWFSIWFWFAPVVVGPVLIGVLVHARHTVRDAAGQWIPFPLGWAAGWQKARTEGLSNAALRRLALLMAVIPAFHRAFTVFKSSLVHVVPFWADPWLMRLDRVIHGGLPHERLAWLARPGAIVLLDRAYLVWHFILLATICWAAVQPDAVFRLRALIAFVLTWLVLGNGLALLCNSGGPWAYAAVTGQNSPYEGLLHQLREVHARYHLFTIGFENRLWGYYVAGKIGPGAGISAMPSLHVAMPALGAMIAWQRSRVVAGILGCYCAIILVGSVLLGWHYAVDGYISIALVPLIWMASGKIVGYRAPRGPRAAPVAGAGEAH